MGQCKFATESLYYKDIFSQNIPVIEYQCITDFSLTAMPPKGDIALRQAQCDEYKICEICSIRFYLREILQLASR